MELNLQFAGVCADLEIAISARNQSLGPQVLAGAGKGHSSQDTAFWGVQGGEQEKKIETRWKIKAGPAVALKSTTHRERIEGLKAA